MSDHKNNNPTVNFLFENSIFLIAGAIAALLWANLETATYQHFINFEFEQLLWDKEPAEAHHDGEHAGEEHADHHDHEPGHDDHDADDEEHKADGDDHAADDEEHEADDEEHDAAVAHGATDSSDGDAAHADGGHGEHHSHPINIAWFINDVLMALFFAIAGKEVWEALLPGGALANPRKAATPLFATLGGILGPVAVYLAGVAATGHWNDLARGWAIPCATDIAFSYLVARIIFGQGHPAISFLLLLAIADDAAGLVILAVAYPQGSGVEQYLWLFLTVGAVAIGFFFRWLRIHSFWWYLLIPGVMSWISFYMAGIHPALGLVPIIPTMPHAHTDLGLFARMEMKRPDTLNEFEHWWKNPVEIILGLFGLVNAGVVLSSAGSGTVWVLAGLLLGKPLGIVFFTLLGDKVFKLEMPEGMTYRHITVIGLVASIGFTVALFVSTVAFADPSMSAVRDSVKMGALGSFAGAFIAIAGAKILGIRPNKDLGDKEKAAH